MSTTIITIGISIIAIFLVFILNKKEKERSDYYLLMINVLLGLMLFTEYWIRENITTLNYFLHVNISFWLFSLYLLYALNLIDQRLKSQTPIWWVFIFTLPFTLLTIWDVLWLQPSAEILSERYRNPSIIYHFFFKLHMLFVIAVGFWLLRLLRSFESRLKLEFSNIEDLRMHWLRNYTMVLMGLYGFSLIAFLIYNFGFVSQIDSVYLVVNALTVIAVFYLSFNGIREYNLAQFMDAFQAPTTPSQPTTQAKPKYESSTLSTKDIEGIYSQLEAFFEREQLFTEPQLKLAQVAKELELSPHHLSQVINTKFGRPFYEFVAHYRVEALKSKLIDPNLQHLTILALALEVGFNSKASLNRIFKAHTGLTPSQYQKTQLAK
ncbi:MAG: AraC family transcriptional regulator [Cyanothece sp. SIO1E1]|nr:AraC family transcriptional regulator [Cyanothece sp. SIO1E1]